MPSEPIKPKRKSCVDETIDRFREFINGILTDVPELRSVALVIDWEFGENDLPHGVILGRSGSPNLDELLNNAKQTQKLLITQMEMIRDAIGRAAQIANELKTSSDKQK